jgi:pilus assembly protein CpaB
MRNLKATGLFALALLLGFAAAVYAARWIADRQAGLATRLVVAAVDLEPGSRLEPSMLTTVEWPTGAVPAGAFKDTTALRDRVLRVGVLRGDAVLERKLSAPGTRGGLSAVISEGKRAMTVRVNDVVGVAGFALPGTYVDVMVNTQQDRGAGEGPNPISLTVLENVLVLAVAQEASRDELKPKVVSAVTLELSPTDAEKLDLARSVGSLSLVLRNQLDKSAVATTGVTRSQLLALRDVSTRPTPVVAKPVAVRRAPRPAAPAPAPEPAAQAPAPSAPRDCVEVMRNSASLVQCF